MREALKPCPFCGGEACLEDMGFPHHVYCTGCGARVTGRGYGRDGELDAIFKWNCRVNESSRKEHQDERAGENAESPADLHP